MQRQHPAPLVRRRRRGRFSEPGSDSLDGAQVELRHFAERRAAFGERPRHMEVEVADRLAGSGAVVLPDGDAGPPASKVDGRRGPAQLCHDGLRLAVLEVHHSQGDRSMRRLRCPIKAVDEIG